MEKILLDIKLNYPEMGKAEKKIADVLMRTPDAILPLSITDFAAKCGVGEATLVRFSRRLGLTGYQQLKISIAQERQLRPINEKFGADDGAADIFAKVCDDVYSSLEQTKKALSGEALQKCCETIAAAKHIYIFGLGNSAPIAQDAAHKLLRLGLRATAYSDNHMQAIAAAHTGPGDVIIGISHSGSSRDIVENMRLGKERGAATIALTNRGRAPIDAVSDCTLYTVSDETNYTLLGLSSRIAQLALVDAIYSYLVLHTPSARDAIARTEKALFPKKY